MTQPAQPDAGMPDVPRDGPTISFMITGSLTPSGNGTEPVAWTTGKPHPLLGEPWNVLAMFVGDGGIEVYSISPGERKGIRGLVPMHWVRYVQESMPFQVFVEELQNAALDALEPDDDDDEPEDDEPEDGGGEPEAPGTNSSTST